MKRNFLEGIARMSSADVVWVTVALTLVIEVITVVLRFGMGLQSTRDTGFIGRLTFGVRIHHGYVGLLLLLLVYGVRPPGAWQNAALIIGGSLLLSDLIHHFLVLWPLTGSPQFDLFYARSSQKPPDGS